MGCRCSKPELDAFEREERLILEHAAMAEKIKVHIRIAVSSHWEKDSKVEEVTFEDHCEVYQSIVESQRSVRWKQYLTKRTLDIITNNACRRGMLDMETEKAIKSETLRLVDDHISTLENKQANEHFWYLLSGQEKVVSRQKYATEFATKFNSILESIYRIVVHHVVSFHMNRLASRRGDHTRVHSKSSNSVCTTIAAC
mmetsp:Transcript_16464/g.24803  ORF Transcript_16464/g.24803 Transcript_16464/m.24803 type:complete len:199 (+) Transcript_16464:158-754(+)